MDNKEIKSSLTTAAQAPLTTVAQDSIPQVGKKEPIPAWAQELQKKVEKLTEENTMLKEMAGKNAIASYEDGKKKIEARKAGFRRYNGKLVVGWGQLDYTHFNPAAADGLRENILTELIYEDGSREKVNYILFNNSTDVVFLEIVKQIGDMTTVILPSGNELTIETKFINR